MARLLILWENPLTHKDLHRTTSSYDEILIALIKPTVLLKISKSLADTLLFSWSIGAKLVIIPGMVGGHEKIKDYFSLFDYDVAQITAALKELK